MTTLVTGACGYLGAAVIEQLVERGTSVRCLVRPTRGARLWPLQKQHGRNWVTLVEGNLLARHDVARALAGVDRVVHLAAKMRGAPADVVLNTVVATRRLLDALPDSDVQRVVLVSSLAVYGLADCSPTLPVSEDAPLEPRAERRDVYTHAKIRQEQMFRELPARSGIARVTLRPGPVYGRGGPEFVGRVGLSLPGLLLQVGGDTPLPLTYVDNCAAAVAHAALDDRVSPGAYNVVDDDVPTAGEYVQRYQKHVRRVRCVRLPVGGTMVLAWLIEQYHDLSRGQIPEVLTPYRALNMWGGHRYDTTRLKATGWRQRVSTADALELAFEAMRARHYQSSRPSNAHAT